MPWVPELFSAPVLDRWLEQRRRDTIVDVPYFDGLMTGELDALIGSFAGEPELHHPVRGRIKGRRAFAAYVADTAAWFAERNVSVEEVERVVAEQRGFEEVVPTSTVPTVEWRFRSRSSRTTDRGGDSTNCGSTTAATR